MIKKLLFLLATVGMIANITSCTSKKSQDDSDIIENAAVDKIDAESQSLDTAAANLAEPIAAEDPSLQAALGETSAATPTLDETTAAATAPAESLSLDAPLDTAATTASTETVTAMPADIAAAPTLDESSLNDIPPPSDSSLSALNEPVTSPELNSVDTNVDTSPAPIAKKEKKSAASFADSPLVESNMSAPVAKSAGSELKKVSMTMPYQAGAGWVNTVYVARPGEKLKDISQKIFAADKSKELKKIAENSYLKARNVKPGDKIYYISPNRPEDSTKTILYYEDVGMVPETYTAKNGDKLKTVAKEILGYDRAWIELWTSNPIESKDKLAEGDTIKYWRSASSINTVAQTQPTTENSAPQLIDPSQMPSAPPAEPTMAANTPPPAPDMNSLPPPAPDMAPPPPEPTMAANTPPPPAPDMAPPPPPAPDMNTPPPPPADLQASDPQPVAKKKFAPGEEEAAPVGGLDQDTLMSLGAVGALVAALAFVIIRKRKRKSAEQNMAEHDVGT